MLKFIFRQIFKQKLPLFLVIIVWLGGGYLIFKNHHHALAWLANISTTKPQPGHEEQSEARFYYERALDHLSVADLPWYCYLYDSESCQKARRSLLVRLDLMKKSCQQLPSSYKNDLSDYKPHWIERLNQWSYVSSSPADETSSDQVVVTEPITYWHDHRKAVKKSIQELLSALTYSYELEEKSEDGSTSRVIVIPELFNQVASALCQEPLGRVVWGDYIEFMEIRAGVESDRPESGESHIYPGYPTEPELPRLLNKLKGNHLYRQALLSFSAGEPPAFGQKGNCRLAQFNLACNAPREAALTYKKLIYILPEAERHFYRLKYAKVNLILINQGESQLMEQTIDVLKSSAQNPSTEMESRIYLAHIYIKNKNYRSALKVLTPLYTSNNRSGEVRQLLHQSLIGVGRSRDADCFSELSDHLYGKKTYCQKLKL